MKMFIPANLKKNKKLWVDETIHLCLPTLDFTAELFTLIQEQRPYLEAFLPWAKNIQKAWHANSFLKEAISLNKGKRQLTTFIIYKQQLAGSLSLLKIDQKDKRAAIGYWLREDLQGKGIMTNSCQCLLQYAFKELHLNRLEMHIAAGNLKSRKIPLRLHFSLEGRLRAYQKNTANGHFEDVDIFGLLKADWTDLAPNS